MIDRHATSQQRVYDDDLDDTQVAQGRNSVGQLYNDDTNYLAQLHVATQARADQVLRAAANDNAPADPDSLAATIASARQATASDFTRARVEGALEQGDVATATALTDRWSDDLLPAEGCGRAASDLCRVQPGQPTGNDASDGDQSAGTVEHAARPSAQCGHGAAS